MEDQEEDLSSFEKRFLSVYHSPGGVTPKRGIENGSASIFSPDTDIFGNESPRVMSPRPKDKNFEFTPEIQSRVHSLNQDLLALGCQSLYNNRGDIDVQKLVSTTSDLCHKVQISQRLREDMHDRQHRADCDYAHLQQQLNHLKASLEQYEREVAKLELKEHRLTEKNRGLQKRLKSERDEVKRLQSVIQHRDAQHQHAIKKREREHLKLKDRIHQLLSDRVDRKAGIHISCALEKVDKRRGTWKTGVKQEEEIFRTVIRNYEDKQKELMVENSELRNGLKELQHDLILLLNSPPENTKGKTKECDNGSLNGDEILADESPDSLSDAHFQMPYDVVRDDILEDIRDKCKQLQNVVKSSGSGDKNIEANPATGFEVKQLKEQIIKYQEIVDQQEKLLQQSLCLRDEESPMPAPNLSEAEISEEKESLRVERLLFAEQKAHFDEERNSFTEAAIRLSRERKAFEEERAAFLQRQFMQISPFISENKTSRRAQSAGHQMMKNRRILPTTPSLSEPSHFPASSAESTTPPSAAQPQLDTPSTADLYQKLGLCDSPSPNSKGRLGQGDRSAASDVIYSPGSSPSPRHSSSGHKNRIVEHIDGIRMNLFDPMANGKYNM